jgi:hypothetical protein
LKFTLRLWKLTTLFTTPSQQILIFTCVPFIPTYPRLSDLYVIATIIMPCFFSVIGQVASVSTGTGRSHNAVVLFQEGPLGGPGDDRYFEVNFWPEGETDLITNKCYLLQGTVVLAEVCPDKREEAPKVVPLNLPLKLLC